MKLTLFTISNEQIKESLNKLQTKVESLETVKEVQDKIIATKDSQISFLNDQIANIWTPITIVAGFIALIFGYVAWLNKQAQKKVEQAELLISQNQETAKIARKELKSLEEKQEKLSSLSTNLITIQKASVVLNSINNMLYYIENNLNSFKSETFESYLKPSDEQLTLFSHFSNKYHHLRSSFSTTLTKFNIATQEEQKISVSDLEGINQLEQQVKKLNTDILNKLNEYEQD
ncbi:hypothetical protein [Bacillus sp. NH11B]|uniref:hypothetical protein n=1 Tax=Bacillus sp. NH11B TaxID=1866314 RepID=UPI0008FE8B55|nr:hypothetical protein [Bacillus sp. NH11B]OJD64770.1 hypothetical protein BAU27_05055 [Bacillus sp. NH11B]